MPAHLPGAQRNSMRHLRSDTLPRCDPLFKRDHGTAQETQLSIRGLFNLDLPKLLSWSRYTEDRPDPRWPL